MIENRSDVKNLVPMNETLNRFPWVGRSSVIAALLALGFGPVLYFHVVGMLARPHYQFLLLFPVAVWMLLMVMPEKQNSDVGIWARATAMALLVVSLAGLMYATWVWSPWVAAVSGMIAFLAFLVFQHGFAGAKRWMPIWFFTAILVPLPFGMDEDLIVRLRSVTTRLTSRLLDQLDVLHQNYANVIELPGKPLFVADACSGIHSLYVLTAMALFLSAFCRRSVVHALALLFSTFGLVIVENVARIAFVALAWQRQMDLSAGWKHSVLGVVLFGISAMLIVTTDQLLLFLFPQDPFSDIAKLVSKFSGGSRKPAVGRRTSSSPSASLGWFCIAAVFPLVGVTQFFRMPTNVPALSAVFVSEIELPDFGKDLLPSAAEGFQLTEFETIHRVAGDPFGRSSQRWVYKSGQLTVGVSLDYPYDGIKDMTQCYESVGWAMRKLSIRDSTGLAECCGIESDQSSVAVVEMERDLLGQALMLFSSFDLKGKSSALLKNLADQGLESRAEGRLQSFGRQQVTEYEISDPPYFQVHLLARSYEPLTAEQEKQVLRLYVVTRDILTKRVLAEAGTAVRSSEKSETP